MEPGALFPERRVSFPGLPRKKTGLFIRSGNFAYREALAGDLVAFLLF